MMLMKVLVDLSCTLVFSTLLLSCSKSDNPGTTLNVRILEPVAIQKTNEMKIFVHYMVWFESKETSTNGKWGYHWTMKSQDPDVIDANGKRQIAAHFYPSIGPYASSDKFLIEYHLLLMKYAGIDGVIIDWYGTHNVNDYKAIKKNTEALVSLIEKTGLQFAIDYEDRTLEPTVQQGEAASFVNGAKDDMTYLKTNFFSKPNYIKISNEPLLLVFGPIVMQKPDDWTQTFTNISPKPCLLTLWYQSGEAGTNARGEYAWVYQNTSSLDNFYTSKAPNLNVAMGCAYPGFKDFYTQGGGGESLGWTIDYKDGITLEETLQKAKNASMKYVQIATWNDFGEGTMIEPTKEFGNKHLETVKNFGGVIDYNNAFENIKKQYDLRLKYKNNSLAQKSLDQSFYYFVSVQNDKAVNVLDSLETNVP